jgi:hypothetical protein
VTSERQVRIRFDDGTYTVCASIADAALFATMRIRCPFSEWQIQAALRVGFPLCGMEFSYEPPARAASAGKRKPLLKSDQLARGLVRLS